MADGAAGFRQGFSGPALLRIRLWAQNTFGYAAFTLFGGPFQTPPLAFAAPTSPSFNPGAAVTEPVWAAPRSLATTCGITVVFSSCGYLDVSVPRVRPIIMVVSLLDTGFPHSEIHGSTAICASPWLIAACHVLLRL